MSTLLNIFLGLGLLLAATRGQSLTNDERRTESAEMKCHIHFYEGHRSIDNINETVKVSTPLRCAYMCLELTECNGFNFNRFNHFCEMLGGDEPDMLTPDEDWRFYWIRNKDFDARKVVQEEEEEEEEEDISSREGNL